MSAYKAELNALVALIHSRTGLTTTRDPGVVPALAAKGGGIFVGFPRSIQRTFSGAVRLEVPVSIVAPVPGNVIAADFFLDYVDLCSEILGTSDAYSGTVDIGELIFPALTFTATLMMEA